MLERWLGLLLLTLGCAPPQERLRTAVADDRPDKAASALKAGADPNQGDLATAVTFERVELARVLLAHKADPNRDIEARGALPRETLIHKAMSVYDVKRRLALARSLLEAGADPNRAVGNDEPPLLAALQAFPPSEEVVQLLLEHKADPNLRWRGLSALDLAVSGREPSVKTVEALVAAGARMQDSAAAPLALASGRLDLFRLVLEKGASIDAACPGGFSSADARGLGAVVSGASNGPCGGLTALGWAAGKGDLETMRMLLDRGAKVDAPESGVRPLHVASRLGRTDAMHLLLARKADPRVLDGEDATALHGAGSGEIIRTLLAAGIPVDALDRDGDTPLMWAVVDGLREPLAAETDAAPEEKADSDTPGPKAEADGEEDEGPPSPPPPRPLALTLLAAGAAPDRPDSRGLRPLHHAAASSDHQTVERLLALGAKAGSRDGKEISPLAYVFEHHVRVQGIYEGGLAPIVSTLLSRGAPGQAVTSKKTSLLTLAVEWGYPGIAALLLDAGADPASADSLVRSTLESVPRQYGNPMAIGAIGGWREDVPSPTVAMAKSPQDKVLAAATVRGKRAEDEARAGAAWADGARAREAEREKERKAADAARAKAAADREWTRKEVDRLRLRGFSEREIDRRIESKRRQR